MPPRDKDDWFDLALPILSLWPVVSAVAVTGLWALGVVAIYLILTALGLE